MQKYIGTKLITAMPMTHDEACALLGRPATHADNPPGYLVEYEGGYRSWSPKDVFEKAYRLTDGMNFGMALEALKAGKRVARRGWNGKGMYLFVADNLRFNSLSRTSIPDLDDAPIEVHPSIVMRTAQRTLCVGWLASQTDMLADDWVLVD